ncbi:MAG: branched-chain-amino-acid transaminase [Armatimonadetes bacterium]|nr:branched-chain-amino-acid transaminase [Armatimonadota bacterium]MBS1711689.1 branched-chain-amino-acid transaminase [Armatimonadota bacterium]MBX3109756.1 branched-chain-amino-acid transaminase [Fimbriimonadaceae bacterium]
MQKLVWFNGEVSPLESATVPAADHAHLYGDGLFEGIRIYGGKVFKLDEHLERLYHGCKFLNFRMEMDQPSLRAQILDVCRQSGIEDGYIRLNVTRGTALGLDPKAVKTPPNVMIMVSTLALYTPDMYETGLNVITTSYRVAPPSTLDQRLKCIGRYAYHILAKEEANRAGAGEGLMLNHEGYVAECTGDNIFIFKDGVLKTPHPSQGLLCGITRNTVIELARNAGIEVVEEVMTRYDILSADEAFLTGTAAEVIPMVSLDNRPIGDGAPGAKTRHIITLFREETKHGVPIGAVTV